mgnify:CR=1 FL=1
MNSFSNDFLWGAATSAYQIEGAHNLDGKGDSIWDTFCRTKGNIRDNTSGEVACDHINRYKEDVDLMSDIGLQAYRFSISWPRILPDGVGSINEKGLDFYDRLIDLLLDKNIKPFITLFHWDLPQKIEDQGGWLNPDVAKWFGDYAGILSNKFSDRVENWFTINEPQVVICLGYHMGLKAPGLKLPLKDVLGALHNYLLAHGHSVKALRDNAKGDIKVGPVPTGHIAYPQNESMADIDAAYDATFKIHKTGVDKHNLYKWKSLVNSAWNFSWYTDPIFLGKYPEAGLEVYGNSVPDYTDKDMEIISEPVDFLGLNAYSGYPVMADDENGWLCPDRPMGNNQTAFKWNVTPDILYWGPRFMYERYKKPIYITENGLSAHDWVNSNGEVNDPQRIQFLSEYLKFYKRAADESIPIKGYFLWSLFDNFEWEQGYEERFGLIHVDFETQKRTPKLSAKWYSECINSNGGIL